jgi:hypothetical protein
MEGQVLRDGQPIFGPKEYTSGGTTGRKNQFEALSTHTERKFLDDVEPILQPGDHLVMKGHYDSCKPGCQPAIRDTVREKKVTAEYQNKETGSVQTFEPAPAGGLTNAKGSKVNGDVVQQKTEKDGTVSERRRYWKKGNSNASAPF